MNAILVAVLNISVHILVQRHDIRAISCNDVLMQFRGSIPKDTTYRN